MGSGGLEFNGEDANIKMLSLVSSKNITEESILLTRNALKDIASQFTDEEIIQLIKKSYIASEKPLYGEVFNWTESQITAIRDELISISKQVGLPERDHLMSKIMHWSLIQDDGSGFIPIAENYRNVGNYVGRAENFKPVSTKQLILDYRLDYDNSKYLTMEDKGYGVIKFKNTEPEKVDFAIGAKSDNPPNTKGGVLGNDSRIIFEYKMEKRELIDGDILEVYDANGKLATTYKFGYNENFKQSGWILIR